MIDNKGQPMQQPHLEDYLRIIHKRKWTLITFFTVLVITVIIGTYRMKPVYRATCQIMIEKDSSERVMFTEAIGVDSSQQDYYQTQYEIIKSRSLAKKVIARLKLASHEQFKDVKEQNMVSAFLAHLEVAPIRNTRLVNINANANDPALAALLANTLAKVYINDNIKTRIAKTSIDSTTDLKLLEQYDMITEDSGDIESLPSVINNRLIQILKGEYTTLETRYAELSKRYKDKHPRMIEITASMQMMREKIDTEIKSIVDSIATERSGVLRGNNIRVIDEAEVPQIPVKPRKKLNIILAVMVGLIGGIGLAFFQEYLDNTVRTKDDIVNMLGLSFLGQIPIIKIGKKEDQLKKDVYVHDNSKSLIAEGYRNIRTNLNFSAVSKKLKSIVITSAGFSEGKTTTVSNLGITLSQGGEKVLIVDADMRKPIMHKVFKKRKEDGLSDYLAGEMKIDEIIKDTGIDGLSLITCGKVPHNPNELLGLEKMEEFISELEGKYDRIIFDSPPVGAISDAMILSKKVDGVILVIQYENFSREYIKHGKDNLSEIGANIVGSILNNIDLEKEGPGRYSYYYYYSNYGHTK